MKKVNIFITYNYLSLITFYIIVLERGFNIGRLICLSRCSLHFSSLSGLVLNFLALCLSNLCLVVVDQRPLSFSVWSGKKNFLPTFVPVSQILSSILHTLSRDSRLISDLFSSSPPFL